MSIYFLHSLSSKKHAERYFFIFKKTYPKKNIFMIENQEINNIDFQKGDIVLSFEIYKFEKLKEITKFVQMQNAKFGLFFGDTIQYYELIYKQFIPLIDFCFTHELGESSHYEMFAGIPSFDHPIFQTANIEHILSKPKYIEIKKRENYFVHLGLLDPKRSGRINMIKAMHQTEKNYKLYGPGSNGNEYLDINEIPQKLSNCIFGLIPCSASSSDPISSNKQLLEYQFKGKIWEYMISGCIPVIDQAPNIYRLGLKEGVHFLSVSSFNKEELNRISRIPCDKLSEISRNAFEFALVNLSIKNFNDKFDDFYHHLKYLKYSSRKLLQNKKPKKIQIAALHYSFFRKKFSIEIFSSGFYLIKIKNIISKLIN